MVWAILNDKANAVGPVARLQAMWNALPAPKAANDDALKTPTQAMRNFVSRIRAHTAMQFTAPIVKGLPGQSEPLHNWRLEEYANNHRKSDPADLRADNVAEEAPAEIPKYPPLHEDASPRWAILSAHARFGDFPGPVVIPPVRRQPIRKPSTAWPLSSPTPSNSESAGAIGPKTPQTIPACSAPALTIAAAITATTPR